MINLALDLEPPRQFVARQGRSTRIIVCGTGGTGSWLVQHLARLVWEFNRAEDHIATKQRASLLLVDYDLVEEKNVRARQNFCPPEIGRPKAQMLANRMALAFTMQRDEISALVKPFSESLVRHDSSDVVLLIGCVDNWEARASLADCLTTNARSEPRVIYLDGGNGSDWGQVFVGNTSTLEGLKGCLRDPICSHLPSPALIAPSLFVAPQVQEEVSAATTKTIELSCGDLVVDAREGNRQSRTINNHMASLLYAYVERLIYGSITTFATWTNLSPISTTSSLITPESLANALGKPHEFASFFTMHPDDGEEDEVEEDEDEEELDYE